MSSSRCCLLENALCPVRLRTRVRRQPRPHVEASGTNSIALNMDATQRNCLLSQFDYRVRLAIQGHSCGNR